MARAFLAAYFSLCYSVGVASLVYALILHFTKNERHLGRFIACTAAMTAIVADYSALHAYGNIISGGLQDLLHWFNLSIAAIFCYLVVAFAAEVFPFRRDQTVKRLALGLSAVGLAFCGTDVLWRDERWLEIVILAIKNAGILGAVAISLLPRGASQPRASGTYPSFLRTVSIAIAVLMPFLLWEEIGSRLGAFPLGLKLSLPAFYGVWSAAFIAAHLRHRTRSAAPTALPDPAFISRYGITPRESELLGLLIEGLSYKSIMSQLCISMPTVKSHIASMYRKTGTANRLELAKKVASESGESAR